MKVNAGGLEKILALVIFITAIAVTGAGCSRGYVSGDTGVTAQIPAVTQSTVPTNGLVQSSEGGGVTIEVKWKGLSGSSLVFEVSLDTHSVDLDVYDLKQLALLRDSGGEEYQPTSWDAAPGGHHRSGTLSFAASAPGQGKSFDLIIRNVAGVKERVLTWKLG